jgi:hypothetical protein
MSKYLITRTYCDNEGADTPDIFVLPLKASDITEFSNLIHLTKSAEMIDARVKALEVDFERGYWLITGDDNWVNELLASKAAVIADGDFMAIVGEDIDDGRMAVTSNGNLVFRCIHSQIYMRTHPISLAVILQAFGV